MMPGNPGDPKPKNIQIMLSDGVENKIKEPWDTKDSSAQEIKDKEIPVNYSEIIGNSRILFLGEDHSNTAIRYHLLNKITKLKEAGITHYAIEANENGSEVFERLNRGESVDLRGVDIGPGQKDYEEVIRAMASAGIKVIPIDIDQSVQPSKEEREARITANLLNIINSDPNAKVVSLIGAFHTSKNKSPLDGFEMTGARLKKMGVPVSTVLFAGGKLGRTGPKMITDAVEKAGLTNKEFALNFRKYTNEKYIPFGTGEADFVIHLPQASY